MWTIGRETTSPRPGCHDLSAPTRSHSPRRDDLSGRRLPGAREVRFEHDGKINPGNSGGQLLDDDGRVIGINTLMNRGEFEGYGYAISLPDIRDRLKILVPGAVWDPPYPSEGLTDSPAGR